MNKENLRHIAKIIREHEGNFNLNTFYTDKYGDVFNVAIIEEIDCGSTACICGWINAEINKTLIDNADKVRMDNMVSAASYLDLEYSFANRLFCPLTPDARHITPVWNPWYQAIALGIIGDEDDPYNATAEQAARVLEAIADEKILTHLPTQKET